MRSTFVNLRWIALAVASVSLAGCASRLSGSNLTAYQMSCPQLNEAITGTAKGISKAAITRENLNVPFWVPGGARAKSALQNRQTGKIERLRNEQATLFDARRRNCG